MLSIEFVVLIVVMASALAGMAVYMRRALSGRWRSVGDTFGHGRQYEQQPGVPQPLPCIPDDDECQRTSWKGGVWRGETPPPNNCPRCCSAPQKYHICFGEPSGGREYDPSACLTAGTWVCGVAP